MVTQDFPHLFREIGVHSVFGHKGLSNKECYFSVVFYIILKSLFFMLISVYFFSVWDLNDRQSFLYRFALEDMTALSSRAC